MRRLSGFIGLIMCAGAVSADHQHVVMGVDVGRAEQQIEQRDFPGAAIDNEDEAYKFYVGLRTGDVFTISTGYIDFGEVSIRDGATFAEAQSDGAFLDLAVGLPLTEYVEVFAKAGLVAWQQDTVDNTLGFVDYHEEQGVDPYWGVGMRVGGYAPLNVKLEFNRYEFKDDAYSVIEDYEVATVGLEFQF